MTIFADFVMVAWIPVVLLLFAVLPPRRAVIVAFFGGFLFLPMATYKLPVLPDYTKISATCAGIMLGAALFDSKRLLKFAPRLIDLPIVVFCIAPLPSSLLNGLGLWDGFSAVLLLVITWGLPYLIGRLYFQNLDDLKELAVAFFIGGLIYIPFCLFEIRMSPQLHALVYGVNYRWGGSRLGGWRPAVFLDTGLQLGMWMTATSLVGFWLWWTGALKKLSGISVTWLVWPLLLTTVMCRSTGALALLLMGLAVMCFSSVTKTRIALIGLIAIVPTYLVLRTTGLWNAEQVVTLAEMFSRERAESLQYRIENENMFVARALLSPVFGWGGWSGWAIFDEWGRQISVSDGLWVIQLGTHGLIGLISCYTALLLPPSLVAYRFPARRLSGAELAPAFALAVMVTLYAIDCLPNAMTNPLFTLSGGALCSVVVFSARGREVAVRAKSGDAEQKRVADAVPARRYYPHAES